MPSVHSVLSESSNTRPCILLPNNQLSSSLSQRHDRQLQGNTHTMIYGAVESKYRHYANITERLKTFQKWLNDYTKTPEELADAGFFYEGYADCVRCFHCAGKTRGWEADDDPWIEHARWFPKCEYVSERKGKNFVAAVQDLSRTHPKISAQMVVERMREINQ